MIRVMIDNARVAEFMIGDEKVVLRRECEGCGKGLKFWGGFSIIDRGRFASRCCHCGGKMQTVLTG